MIFKYSLVKEIPYTLAYISCLLLAAFLSGPWWIMVVASVIFGGRLKLNLRYDLSREDLVVRSYTSSKCIFLTDIVRLEVHKGPFAKLFDLKGQFFIKTSDCLHPIKSMLYNEENESLIEVLKSMDCYEVIEKPAKFLVFKINRS